jgi:hypothetical protein
MTRHIEAHNFASIMADYEEAIQVAALCRLALYCRINPVLLLSRVPQTTILLLSPGFELRRFLLHLKLNSLK